MNSAFWQKCPICEGTGKLLVTRPVMSNFAAQKCHVCNGWGIISTFTGTPPSGEKDNYGPSEERP